ncbi:PINc/VapC family ATPase [Thermoproteus tenax]|uniref:ATPase, PilT family n=1 Tax=Thermoproteus tenax (strain ATCC 35583 / DSM 2078 / JCM 9277 / NBRC 100435 / Kra 1) TaxID=768679 RepID=G4RJG9_THETK|nr:PINc/VapC family ATPase [Thermoproteus tenax]CCC81714.1 ATPase, PilT family [Thermoproteus tenax Kra 1]
MAKYVVDISTLLDGSLKEAVISGAVRGSVLVPEEALDYLERLARQGDGVGLIGMEELRDLRSAIEKLGLGDLVKLEFITAGRRGAEPDELPSIVRRLAKENGAVVVTSDPFLRDSAAAMGLEVLYLGRERQSLTIEKFFGKDVMSVHLKEGVPPQAKAGRPGSWRLVRLSDEPMTRQQLEVIARELVSEAVRGSGATKLEIRRPHSMIIQHKDLRIVVTFPPVSDGLEITAVKPLVKRRLEDYGLDPKIVDRLEKSAEGILISGPPGAGKTTFAQALAEFYLSKGRIVKTIESPRDMVLDRAITQLSKNYATSEELHDLLLLSRPDYTIFDEMRDTADFQLYVDLRLAGVGMVGVVHATSPIDAVQRFVRRVELGMIPSIIDTVIFMKDGEVKKVYSLAMTVKVPAGMREEDLSRPVVVVKDFLTGEPEFEIYVFGEETFVVPLKRGEGRAPSKKLYSAVISALKRYVPPQEIRVEEGEDGVVVVKVPEEYLSVVVSRGVNKLEKLRRRFAVDFRVEPL